jgi:hypothetical protein
MLRSVRRNPIIHAALRAIRRSIETETPFIVHAEDVRPRPAARLDRE